MVETRLMITIRASDMMSEEYASVHFFSDSTSRSY